MQSGGGVGGIGSGGARSRRSSSFYDPRYDVGQLVQEHQVLNAMLRQPASGQEVSEMSEALLCVMEREKKCVMLLRSAIGIEVERTADFSMLFRGHTVGVKMLSEYSKRASRDYVERCLQKQIEKIVKKRNSFEIDPVRLRSNESIDKNRRKLKRAAQSLLNSIVVAGVHIPHNLREIYTFVAETVGAKFVGSVYTALGGLIFLRLLCPAITAPDTVGLVEPGAIDSAARRRLLLVAKLLQSLANTGREHESASASGTSSLSSSFSLSSGGAHLLFGAEFDDFSARNRSLIAKFFGSLVDGEFQMVPGKSSSSSSSSSSRSGSSRSRSKSPQKASSLSKSDRRLKSPSLGRRKPLRRSPSSDRVPPAEELSIVNSSDRSKRRGETASASNTPRQLKSTGGGQDRDRDGDGAATSSSSSSPSSAHEDSSLGALRKRRSTSSISVNKLPSADDVAEQSALSIAYFVPFYARIRAYMLLHRDAIIAHLHRDGGNAALAARFKELLMSSDSSRNSSISASLSLAARAGSQRSSTSGGDKSAGDDNAGDDTSKDCSDSDTLDESDDDDDDDGDDDDDDDEEEIKNVVDSAAALLNKCAEDALASAAMSAHNESSSSSSSPTPSILAH
jgi:GTPase-activator protein for Ras-like GTPase